MKNKKSWFGILVILLVFCAVAANAQASSNCADCNGTGGGQRITCTMCNGSGTYRMWTGYTTVNMRCTMCNATGLFQFPCFTCGGTGRNNPAPAPQPNFTPPPSSGQSQQQQQQPQQQQQQRFCPTCANVTGNVSLAGRIQGNGRCYHCNSRGQSNACVANPYGTRCSDSRCIAGNHRCWSCGGTNVCTGCRGTGLR